MKKFIPLPMVLALLLFAVCPLRADLITYSWHSNISLYIGTDSLGLGANPTATITFTVDTSQPPSANQVGSDLSVTGYYASGATLNLAGTAVDGTYTPSNLDYAIVIYNFFSSVPSGSDIFGFGWAYFDLPQAGLSGTLSFDLYADLYLPISFWGDGENPMIPKPFDFAQVSNPSGYLWYNPFQEGEIKYHFDIVSTSVTVVPAPASLLLLTSGLLGLLGWRRCRKI
jgi:hypothetical protein